MSAWEALQHDLYRAAFAARGGHAARPMRFAGMQAPPTAREREARNAARVAAFEKHGCPFTLNEQGVAYATDPQWGKATTC